MCLSVAMRRNLVSIVFFFLSPLLLSVNSLSAEGFERLTILHTNDHHGRFWSNDDDEYGMAARKTLIESIREEVRLSGGHTLLLSGGDINTGVPESDLQDAEPDFRGMRELGYDAMAIGNHEFDKPFRVLSKQMSWAGFPFLSANIFEKGTEKNAFTPYITKKLGNLVVTIVGFTTNDTPYVSAHGDAFDFKSPIEIAKHLIPKLRPHCDLLIAVTHMGHYENASHGRRAPGDVSLARAVQGIDLIIGGHTQIPLHKPDIQNGTYIVQAHEWGKYVGRVDLKVMASKVLLNDYKLIPINLLSKNQKTRIRTLKNELWSARKEGNLRRIQEIQDRIEAIKNEEERIENDPKLYSFLEEFQKRGDRKLTVNIGETKKKLLGRYSAKGKESALGRLISESFRRVTSSDIGAQNAGGIRKDIEVGPFSYRDLLQVLPFGNQICVAKMNAQKLRKLILHPITSDWHYVGIKRKMKDGKLIDLKVNRQPIDPKRKYTIAANCFMTKGMVRDIPEIDESEVVDSGFNDALSVVEYLKKNPIIEEDDFSESSIEIVN